MQKTYRFGETYDGILVLRENKNSSLNELVITLFSIQINFLKILIYFLEYQEP